MGAISVGQTGRAPSCKDRGAGCIHIRACSIHRIGIQIPDPSDPSESTEHFILNHDCCHVDEVIKWRSQVTQKGERRTHRARRRKRQQEYLDPRVCVPQCVQKMIFTRHIRTKVTFGSVGSGQPCSPRWVDRIQIQRIWVRVRPIERVRIQWIRFIWIPILPIEHAPSHIRGTFLSQQAVCCPRNDVP